MRPSARIASIERPVDRRSTGAASAPAAARGSFSAAEALDGERAVYGFASFVRASAAPAARACPRAAAARTPPATSATRGWPRRVEHRRGQRLGTPSAGPARRRRGGTPPSACRAAHRRRRRAAARARPTARCCATSAPIGVGGRRVADEAERFGGAALHERRRIAERGDERLARGRVAEQAERERRHLPHFGIGVREQRRRAARRRRAGRRGRSRARRGGGRALRRRTAAARDPAEAAAAAPAAALLAAPRAARAAAAAAAPDRAARADPRAGGSTPSSARSWAPVGA